MTRIPARLARRIDRLARHAHRFHRFAHHPLCRAYAGELVPLGRRARVCRGCSLAAAGLLLGIVAGACSPVAPAGASAMWVGASWAALAGALTWGRARHRQPDVRLRQSPEPSGFRRPDKLVTRLVPALLAGAGVGQGLSAAISEALLAGAAALAGALVFAKIYRRRGPDRSPCSSCPERLVPAPCSGLLPIVRRERAFRRLSGRWLAEL